MKAERVSGKILGSSLWTLPLPGSSGPLATIEDNAQSVQHTYLVTFMDASKAALIRAWKVSSLARPAIRLYSFHRRMDTMTDTHELYLLTSYTEEAQHRLQDIAGIYLLDTTRLPISRIQLPREKGISKR